ncbi:hypothetical protein [Nocardioides ferulae]|uniref:hypothetical protein n=1 Tax=Nocardioides ferulae TaxID=2340821 RepID=UPI000EAF5A2E|nr:hypothetical protein [Nocardioides ferulae]
MQRLLALVPVLVLTSLCAALALPAPATAGGPTSVLITEPATGRATALYYSDARYAELDELLTLGTRLDGEPTGLGRRTVNLTWMLHDVEPWRSQTVYPDADGGPVVASYDRAVGGEPAPVEWHRLTDRRAVVSVLASVFRGRPAPAAAAPDPASAADPAGAPAADPVVTERVVTRTQEAWWSLSGWRWLLPGLAVGAGAALLLTRRREAPEPRRVLTDAAPEEAVTARR